MIKHLQLLEEVQEIYAQKYGFTIWVLNEKGEMLLQPVGDNDLCNTLLETVSINWKEKLETAGFNKRSQSYPVFYDILPGVYFLMYDAVHEDGSKSYICAGSMITEGTEMLVTEELKPLLGEGIDGLALMKSIPIITDELKAKWPDWMRKFGELIELVASNSYVSNEISRSQNELFQLAIKAENRIEEQLLVDYSKHQAQFDFLGIAQNVSDGLFRVTAVTGKGMERIKGIEFSLGEGFLGRSLLLNDFQIWQSIAKDPRLFFFTQHSINPKSLFAYPILTMQEETILFFGGHFTKTFISDADKELTKTFAYMLEAHSVIHALKLQNDLQLQRLSSLSEISSLMAKTQDTTKIIYLLVDITLNLIDSTFSCVVLKDFKSNRIKVISRGKPDLDFKSYAKKVSDHYLSDESGTVKERTKEPVIFNTEWGERVIECSLFNGQKVQGVLCAGMNMKKEDLEHEHRNFLQTLSIIAGTSLQMANSEEDDSEDHQVYLLYRAVAQVDKEKYLLSKEASQMASSYVIQLGLDAELMKDIIYACRLSYYEPEFIQEVLPNRKVDMIVNEGNALMVQGRPAKWEECSVGGQIYGQVLSYARHKSLRHLPVEIKDRQLVQTFMSAMETSAVTEEEITPDEEIVKDEKLHSVASSIKEMNLSPREQEVLDLVVKGLNNKEIAKELFISGHTVKNHVTKIFQKLEVPDRAHAISKVYRNKYQYG